MQSRCANVRDCKGAHPRAVEGLGTPSPRIRPLAGGFAKMHAETLDSADRPHAWNRFRHSLAWRLIIPIPLALAAAIGLVWAVVPPAISKSAVDEAIRSAAQTAAQFKIMRGYYTENVVNKLVKQGLVKATSD